MDEPAPVVDSPAASGTVVTTSTSVTHDAGNGVAVSRKARDIALFLSLIGVFGITLASFFSYPLYEAGASMGLLVLSNVVSTLLGMKAGAAMAARPGG